MEIKVLKACVEKVIDYRGKTPGKLGGDWTNDGFRVISALNVHGGNIDNIDSIRCVNESVYRAWMKEEVQREDCFLASEGASLGENAIWDSDEKIVLGQRLYAIRTKRSILDPWYFAFYMQTDTFQKQVHGTSTGSTVFGISQPTLLSLKIVLPAIEEQRKIGRLYKAIKGKIDNNNKVINNLESMAKTLYDYWFVQFDFPNANGRPYKTSGGKMEWNENLSREIPAGWDVSNIGYITENFDSQRIPLSAQERQAIKGEIPYYGATDVMDYVNRPIFKGQYVLIAEDGSVMDVNGFPFVQMIYGDSWVNNHAHVLRGKNGYSNERLYLLLKEIPVVSIKTGSIQAKINQNNLNSYNIVLPSYEVASLFDDKIIPVFDKIRKIKEENRKLTSLRDFLLPMLMNGQVTFHQ